jgi:hypothetical protein
MEFELSSGTPHENQSCLPGHSDVLEARKRPACVPDKQGEPDNVRSFLVVVFTDEYNACIHAWGEHTGHFQLKLLPPRSYAADRGLPQTRAPSM